MLMHRNLGKIADKDELDIMPAPSSLKEEKFTPLSQRIAADQNELSAGLGKLKAALSADDFDRYIESLISLRLHGQVLWLITDRAMHRSILERKFISQLKNAFDVSHVRVISQD